MNEYATVILAAGASTRLGTPKQLLEFQGETLIARLVATANAVSGDQVIVVTGKLDEELRAAIPAGRAHFVRNAHWVGGMGSSIAAGVAYLQTHFPNISGAILTVCDQPFVTSEILQGLIENATDRRIVASHYADTLGTPVLFPARYFPDLLKLNGQEGARKLLKAFQSEVVSIPFPLGIIDVDTPADYQNLLEK